MLLRLPGCESEQLLETLLLPLTSAILEATGNGSHAGSTIAARTSGKVLRQLHATSTLILPYKLSDGLLATPTLVVVMRHPIDRLVALFNAHGPEADVAPHPHNHSTPLDRFKRSYIAMVSHWPSMTCVLAGMDSAVCRRAATDRIVWNSSTASIVGSLDKSTPARWPVLARRRLQSAQLVLVEDLEASWRAACMQLVQVLRGDGMRAGHTCSSLPRQLPVVLGSEGLSLQATKEGSRSSSSGGYSDSGYSTDADRIIAARKARSNGGSTMIGEFLVRESLATDRTLLPALRQHLADDLALYAFARKLTRVRIASAQHQGADDAGRRVNVSSPRSAARAVHLLRRCANHSILCPSPFDPFNEIDMGGDVVKTVTSAAVRTRQWADDFLARARLLQRDAPPSHRRAVLFTHIPKCAGSTFRNKVLFEFTRVHRAHDDFACVLYRDVNFREAGRAPSNLSRHGPACLSTVGLFHRHLLVVTGHVSFHASVISRFPTKFASVVFLREPISRLVSLFNMYPDNTFGRPPPNATTAALRFEDAYRKRFYGRNALTCFIAGTSLCDSVGALGPTVISRTTLQRARFNLAHRYDVFGLTERTEESMALIAWAFGWTSFYKARVHPQKGASNRIVPGEEYHRLSSRQLCSVPGLLEDMQNRERYDVLLHRFAQVLYKQRLASLPLDALTFIRNTAVRPRPSARAARYETAQNNGYACHSAAALRLPSGEGGSEDDDAVEA